MPRWFKITILLKIIFIGVIAWGFFIEPGLLFEKDLQVPHWSQAPIKIAFFSDLHAGSPHINESYIKDLIQRINAMAPDIILIGGDLVINGVVGGTAIPFEDVAIWLRELKAPLGVYAVLGNHDWWNDGDKIRKILEKNNITVLENESKLMKLQNGSQFWLVGIGDDFTNHADVKKALSQIQSEDPRILFMHDPAAIFEVKNKFFLALAGHMHGGQVYIPGIGALVTPGGAPKEWAQGWADFELGSLYVSKGVGTSILPVRLNAPPEFVVLNLRP